MVYENFNNSDKLVILSYDRWRFIPALFCSVVVCEFKVIER